METRTRFGHLEIDDNGRLFLKVWREVWNGDQRIGESQPHRFPMELEISANKFLQLANMALMKDGFPPLDEATAGHVIAHAAVIPGKEEAIAKNAAPSHDS